MYISCKIMTDRETPLAEIIGQMSLSKKYADVSIQSWVFISVNDDLTKLARCLYTHGTAGIKGGL